MTTHTQSYRARRVGRRARAAGTHAAIDAVTGEKIAEATSEGLDFKAMLEYGRTRRRAGAARA